MGWHSRETMRIYDHTFSIQEAVHTLHEFQRKAEHRVQMALQEPCVQELSSTPQGMITIIEDVEPPNAFAQLWEELV